MDVSNRQLEYVVYHTHDLSAGQRRLLLYISIYDYSEIRIETIAKDLGYSTSSILKSLAVLREKGLIRSHRKWGCVNTYRACI